MYILSEGQWLEKPLRISVNPRIFNKNECDDFEAFVQGWENKELTIVQLAGWVKDGYAYCSALSGYRSAKAFTASGVLSVDVDEGMTWEEAKKHPLVKSSATMMYTSASHTNENHKFRIVFALEEPIVDASKMKAATRSLALRLSGDPSVTDPSRLFYGNKGCHFELFNNGLAIEEVDGLVQQSLHVRNQQTVNNDQNGSTPASGLIISKGHIITTAKGIQTPIENLDRKTSVYCPYHNDNNASAFIVENKRQEKGIHCSTCGSTFWTNTSIGGPDFSAFDNTLKAIRDNGEVNTDDVFQELANFSRKDIAFTKEKYLPTLPAFKGATFIKSPKGSGKTEFLAKLIAQSKGNILLIGHRRSLIKQMCERLNLNCYLDDEEAKKNGDYNLEKRQRRYGICLDSIVKIKPELKYDYILIDESEQVLSHFLSDTLTKVRVITFQKFCHLVSTSKNLYALDADLDFTSLHFLSKWFKRHNTDKKIRVILNEFVEEQGTVEVFNKKNHIIGDIHKSIEAGLKCYITSGAKSFIDELSKIIKRDNKNTKFISITSETIGKDDSAPNRFLNNPALESKKYDVVLASPSVSSGVDISFDEDEKYFDVVYGVFSNHNLTHFEIDQQISRVRHPKSVKVHITPRIQFFESNFDVVMFDTRSMAMMDHLVEGYNIDGSIKYRTDDELLQLACAIHSFKRKSINRLRKHFLDHRKSCGWSIDIVDEDKDLLDKGLVLHKQGQKLSKQEKTNTILNAKSISEDAYIEILEKKDADIELSEQEKASFLKASVERFYKQEASTDLIELDNNGRLRSAIRHFENFTNPEKLKLIFFVLENSDKAENQLGYLFKSSKNELNFIFKALTAAGLITDHKLDTELEFSKNELQDFVAFIRKNRTEYETITNLSVRADFSKKPIFTLNTILKMTALKTIKKRKTTFNGESITYYHIDPSELERIQSITDIRSKKGK